MLIGEMIEDVESDASRYNFQAKSLFLLIIAWKVLSLILHTLGWQEDIENAMNRVNMNDIAKAHSRCNLNLWACSELNAYLDNMQRDSRILFMFLSIWFPQAKI